MLRQEERDEGINERRGVLSPRPRLSAVCSRWSTSFSEHYRADRSENLIATVVRRRVCWMLSSAVHDACSFSLLLPANCVFFFFFCAQHVGAIILQEGVCERDGKQQRTRTCCTFSRLLYVHTLITRFRCRLHLNTSKQNVRLRVILLSAPPSVIYISRRSDNLSQRCSTSRRSWWRADHVTCDCLSHHLPLVVFISHLVVSLRRPSAEPCQQS